MSLKSFVGFHAKRVELEVLGRDMRMFHFISFDPNKENIQEKSTMFGVHVLGKA